MLGMGSYSVKKNTLMAGGVPFMHSHDSSIELKHKEFICDISSSVAFTIQQALSINPGNEVVFPYLSQIAVNFERYELLGCVFYFRSTSADALNSTNTALGTLIMATDYDVLDATYLSKQEMEAAMFACSGKPSSDQMHPIECAPSQRFNSQLFIRNNNAPLPSGADQKTYDWGNFQLATSGSQAVAVIGELWVSYHVRLHSPQLTVPRGLNLKYSHVWATAYSNAIMFGTANVLYTDRWVNPPVVTLASNVITFPKNNYGQYKIDIIWVGAATACTAPTVALVNCGGPAWMQNHTTGNSSNGGSTVSTFMMTLGITITDPLAAATLTFSAATLPAAGSGMDLFITQLNGGVAMATQ